MSNFVKYLAALISGDTTGLPVPQTNVEKYLAKALGIWDGTLPEPKSMVDVYLAQIAEQGIGGGDDLEITNTSYLFYDGARIDAIDVLFDHIPHIEKASYMFRGCTDLRIGTEDLSTLLPADFIKKLKTATSVYGIFNQAGALKSFPDIEFDLACDVGSMFYDVVGLETVGNFTLPAAPTNNGFQYLFRDCRKLKSVGNIRVGDNEKIECSQMFSGCKMLERTGGLNFKPSNAYRMFYDCASLKEVPAIDLTECSYISEMFRGCSGLKGTVNLGKNKSAANLLNVFTDCLGIEEIEDFYISYAYEVNAATAFPKGTAVKPAALKKLTFHPESTYTGVSLNISYCMFDRAGMVEFFNSLLDISESTASSTYKTITITGNPCVANGMSLAREQSYSAYKTYDDLCAAANMRYRGFDYQNAPVMYYKYGASSATYVETVFSEVPAEIFEDSSYYVRFLADTLTVPEEAQLTAAEKQIALDKGWTLVE